MHCIRLRNDFPYAITVMLHFIETSHYVFDQQAFAKFPLLTTLDFHIHIYLVGSKYGISALQDCAMNAYLSTAEHEINSGLFALAGGQLSNIQVAVPGFSVMAPTAGHDDGELTMMPIDRFLNSLVLLWKNTQSRYDAMRKAVLELIKHDLNRLLRVPFFVTLMQEMAGFGHDVVASLGDDGLEVKAFQIHAGARQDQTIRFGV